MDGGWKRREQDGGSRTRNRKELEDSWGASWEKAGERAAGVRVPTVKGDWWAVVVRGQAGGTLAQGLGQRGF